MNKLIFHFFKSFILLIFIYTIITFTLKAQVNNDKTVITKFDTDLMANKYLKDFKFLRKNAFWNYGRKFVYENNKNKGCIFITIGLHSSNEAANEIVKTFLNEMSISMVEGKDNTLIGDKFWWWAPDLDSTKMKNIIFIRKNATIIMSCTQNISSLKTIAISIDKGIINKEEFIRINSTINIPEIKTMSKDKEIVNVGDLAKITITAIDINKEFLEYQFSPGLVRQKNDSENVFTYKASYSFNKGLPEIKTIKAVVINESNVVSVIKELNINSL